MQIKATFIVLSPSQEYWIKVYQTISNHYYIEDSTILGGLRRIVKERFDELIKNTEDYSNK